MTATDPSLRHALKLADTPPSCEPVYVCQLCGRRGDLEQMRSEECRKRSGAIPRITAEPEKKSPE